MDELEEMEPSNPGADNALISISVVGDKNHQSLAGYWFYEDDSTWTLDKDNVAHVGRARMYFDGDTLKGYFLTLAHYARTTSAAHTRNICDRVYAMLRDTKASNIDTIMLINYRATLTRDKEWYLATIRGFLYKWHELGYSGVSDDVVDLLKGWRLRGNIKGDAVQRLDPKEGPLTDNELLAFNEGSVRLFEKDKLSITKLGIALLISHTGRRPRQIVHTKICDMDDTKKNKNGETMYLIHIPRAKQRGEFFRNSFKTFAVTFELWVVLDAQRSSSITSVENILGYKLQDVDRRALPLFPDLNVFRRHIGSIDELSPLLATDYFHLKRSEVTETLKSIVNEGKIYSERTGEILNIGATRFRYTKGTRAAREGFGHMVIAELLDHTDTQNVGVYTKNLPDHARALNKAMALQLAPYAQAFQGVLVDREEFAERGHDLTSRIKYRGKNTATCGQYGFCGANAPIPCYTCMHFQPWLEGPHEEVLVDLLAKREEVEKITGDSTMAAINDRTILAVVNVIQRCDARRNELTQNNNKAQ
jgi:integrase